MESFAPRDQADLRPLPEVLRKYGQRARLVKTESMFHLAGLVDDRGGTYESYRKTDEEIKEIKHKGVRAFYIAQNELLDLFCEVDEVLDSTTAQLAANSARSDATEHDSLLPLPVSVPNARAEQDEREAKDVRLTININLLINIILLAGKVVAAFLSNSISLIASLVDSFMDLMSTLIIGWTNWQMDFKDKWRYPVGKQRMEPMGIVIFSVLMISSFVQVFVESAQRLFSPGLAPAEIPLAGIIVMLGTIVVKGIVWLWCRRKKNSSVRALAQDAENDTVFNIFSLLFPFLGQRLQLKWFDAVGGLLLSTYIIYEWMVTLIDNVKNLTGRRGSPKQHNRVVYLCTRFSPLVKAVQHVHVYRAGDNHVVEVDIIVPPTTPLPQAHGIGEAIQYSLESLQGFERAFVHTDITANSSSGHFDR